MTSIEINDIDKVYQSGGNSIHAVESLDLTIQDGEFLVFVGPSGCGKTTTLRSIAGLETVTSGEIKFDEKDVTDLRASERDVAMVFQDYALYPHMSVRKNIGFGLRLSTEYSESEIQTMVEETAELLDISELLDQAPPELSGGQQQRVALGRAIIREPSVFLLDEPLSNLDAKLRDTMRKEILQLQKNLDITSVYVTHDQTEAMAMGDRVAVMNDGKLQQVGAPESVYRNPVNRFVAGFLGSPSMNFVDVGVHQAEDGYIAFDGPGNFSYRAAQSDLPHGIRNQSEVTLGIRPEDLRITDDGGVNSEVSVVEAMGDENIVYTNVGGEEMIARVDSGQKLSNGDSAALEFDAEDLYLFDKHTGEALKTKDAMASEESTAQQQVSTAE